MNRNTENLEKMIEIFIKDQSNENKSKLLNELLKSRLLVPGRFPEGADVEKLKEAANGKKIELPGNMKPVASFIQNSEGELFIPVFVSKEQIPEEPKPQVVMDIPFQGIIAMALQPGMNLKGIALNPYKENILLKEPFLKHVQEQIQKTAASANSSANSGNIKQIRLTPEQIKMILRRKSEMEMIPKALYENPKEFTDTLCDKKEEYLKEFYQMLYKNPSDCSYQTDDFSIMPLNIREDLLLIRADLPPVKGQAPVALRVYILFNEEKNIADYYTIECGKEKDSRIMGRVVADLHREDLGEAPVEGAEIQSVLDLYDNHHKVAN